MIDEGPSSEDLDRFGGDGIECPRCGADVWGDLSDCPKCGATLDTPRRTQTARWFRNKQVTLLIIAIVVALSGLLGLIAMLG